ncbi:MAG: hypothetical protein DMG42_18425 [Acidobacteria bacterium]|nr:MAG: hypothetical protein DMG42_18425 [Acidobacteriota bacterium]
MKPERFLETEMLVAVLAAWAFATGCGGGPGIPPGPLTVSLSTSTVVAPQDGTPAAVGATVSGASSASSLSVTASNLPSGVTWQFVPAAGGLTGTLSLVATSTTPSGTYSANVVVTEGTRTASQPLVLVIAIAASVANAVDTTLGVGGKLDEFMSTSFQPSEGNYQFFQNHTATEPTQLTKLGPQHIRLQAVSQGVPMKVNTGAATDWNFATLDAVVQPVLSAADNSPEFQIAVAPAFLNDPTTGHFIFNSANVQAFADYSANLVRYYNKGGFTWGGTTLVSPSYPQHPITWWGIFNEYNINGLTASQYIQLYNTVVPAMLSVDYTIKISALELAVADPTTDLPPFVAAPANGGVSAQVNVVATHFYPTCNQQDVDATLFSRVPQMVQYINYVYQQLRTRSDLASVPLWVTENNVNADYPNPDGTSNCNPTMKFVSDPRGTNPFFAAFRPYVFSEFGKAGNQALYHWLYAADTQSGEVEFNTGSTYLSYWVDYWLAQMFPSTPTSPGPDILQLSATETSSVEIVATKSSDGSVVLMIVDHAVHAPTDNNGPGDPRTVIADVSSLGTFSSATSITIDAKTNATSGPTAVGITPGQKISVTLGSYGVTFLKLKP